MYLFKAKVMLEHGLGCRHQEKGQGYILVMQRGTTRKNRYLIHLFLFDPELNFVISISSSYELQIGWFDFLNFSKIRIYYLVAFVCTYLDCFRNTCFIPIK